MWRSLTFYTRAEKQGMLDGVSLFFGALLGTNLGSLNGLKLIEYAGLIVVLAGTVMSLRIFSTTERRWHGYLLLAAYSFIILHFLFLSDSAVGIPSPDRQRLAVTLAIWMGTVLLAELVPSKEVVRASDTADR